MEELTLKVVEIFYSLQGEGLRTGQASIFIRLAGCNKSCWFCDTHWKEGKVMTLSEIQKTIERYPKTCIVWTGGEPTLQLTDEIVYYFSVLGYRQAIETNGSNPVPYGIDYVAVSPKVPVYTLCNNLRGRLVNEIRYVVPIASHDQAEQVDMIPKISDLPRASHYYLSPVYLGTEKKELSMAAVNACVSYIKEHPEWELSIQIHKLIDIP